MRQKLLLAAPRILEQNRLMVTQMLEMVKAETEPESPAYQPGPRGGGLAIEVSSHDVRTTGKLKAAAKGYWREFGTRGRFRGRTNQRRAYAAAIGAFGGGGEKPQLTATRALNTVRRFISTWYGKAQWWRL